MSTRRRHFRHRHLSGAGRRADAGPGMLWTGANVWGIWIVGYSLEQMNRSSYSGAPATEFWFDDFNGVVHNVYQLMDGTIIISTSDEGGPNAEESWFVVEEPNLLSGGYQSTEFRRIRVDSFVNWAEPDYGSRTISQFIDGPVLLGRGGITAKLTLDQLYGVTDHTTAPVMRTDPFFIGFDTLITDTGLVWICSDSDVLAAVETTDPDTNGSVAVTKLAQGTNIDTLGGCAMDSTGGMWISESAVGGYHYFTSAQLAAMTDVPSNPSPTRSLTSPVFDDPAAYWTMAMDNEDGMWCAAYQDPGLLVYFTSAQLAAGGAQTPERVVTLPFEAPATARLNVALGPHR